METRFDNGREDSSDPVERAGSRPDFAVVVYPGFRPGVITVPKNAPPTFLVCANDDPSHVVTTVSGLPVAKWPDRLEEWLIERKLISR